MVLLQWLLSKWRRCRLEAPSYALQWGRVGPHKGIHKHVLTLSDVLTGLLHVLSRLLHHLPTHKQQPQAASQEAGAQAPAPINGTPVPALSELQGHSHSVKAAAPDASMCITRCVDAPAPQGAQSAPQGAAAPISSLMGAGAAAPQGALRATRRSHFDEHHKVRRCGSTTRCTLRTTRCRHFDEHRESSMQQHRKARPTKASPTSLKQSRLCTVLYRAVLIPPRPSPPSTRLRQPHP